ncbi:MAG: adenosylcobinamide amidohydrolase [Acidaminococcales bacterium]|jgi:adenosylcobinamide hydrolase|nr:adenosylcobinamide amidohydrolase [Acidaminococcales bacterium]
MLIAEHRLIGGGRAEIGMAEISFRFDRPRTVLSTSEYNGGIKKVYGVFNQELPPGVISAADLPGGTVPAYFAIRSEELGFSSASGLLTSARMPCYGYYSARAGEITVQAFATGGVEGNAARAGEAPLYGESASEFVPLGGTINLFVFLSFALSPGLLTRALVTLTEAKSALLAELGVFSTYGEHTATGTGTDGVIVAMNDGGRSYNDVGTHSEVGHLLAKAAKKAIASTLCRECYWGASARLSAARVLERLKGRVADKEALYGSFRQLSFAEQESLTEGLTVWYLIEERRAWNGLSAGVYGWLRAELMKKYPILSDWLCGPAFSGRKVSR